jgi:hypothetical protein
MVSVVAYTGIQNRTHDSAVKNDLSNLKKMLELSYIDNNRYHYNDIVYKASHASYAVLPTATHNLTFCFTDGNRSYYAIVALSKSGNKYYITESDPITEFTGIWTDNAMTTCQEVSTSYNNNLRGYAEGTWRPWAGG